MNTSRHDIEQLGMGGRSSLESNSLAAPSRRAKGGDANRDQASDRRLPVGVARSIIPIYEREYKELSENWATLERKAQLAAAAAGTILTVGLGFLGSERFSLPGPFNLVFPVVALLVAWALLAALRALWVSDETLPPAGEDIRGLAWELTAPGSMIEPAQFEVESLHLQLVHWDTACKDLHKSLAVKGSRVRCAQYLLLATAVAAFLVIGGVGILELVAADALTSPANVSAPQ